MVARIRVMSGTTDCRRLRRHAVRFVIVVAAAFASADARNTEHGRYIALAESCRNMVLTSRHAGASQYCHNGGREAERDDRKMRQGTGVRRVWRGRMADEEVEFNNRVEIIHGVPNVCCSTRCHRRNNQRTRIKCFGEGTGGEWRHRKGEPYP